MTIWLCLALHCGIALSAFIALLEVYIMWLFHFLVTEPALEIIFVHCSMCTCRLLTFLEQIWHVAFFPTLYFPQGLWYMNWLLRNCFLHVSHLLFGPSRPRLLILSGNLQSSPQWMARTALIQAFSYSVGIRLSAMPKLKPWLYPQWAPHPSRICPGCNLIL